METFDIFPVKLIKTKVEQNEVIKDYLMKHVLPHFNSNGINDKTNNTYTDYLPGATQIYWPFLYNLYRPIIISMLRNLNIITDNSFNLKITGWYVFAKETGSTFIHDHTGGPTTINFSCVHYVNLEKDTMGTVFQNPSIKLIKATTPTKNLNKMPEYFKDYYYNPPVEEGDMIMFPSWLDHFIPPHKNNTLRITVPLNVMLRLDSEEGM